MTNRFIQPEEYKIINYFSPSEFHRPFEMDFYFLRKLDLFREYLGCPIILTSTNGGVHEKNSQHYKGLAVDIIVPEYKNKVFELYLKAERFGFTGIGIYPDWQLDGKIHGGLHIDQRIPNRHQGARWIGVKGEDGRNQYFALDYENLLYHAIIEA